jgi:hypothetical protein
VITRLYHVQPLRAYFQGPWARLATTAAMSWAETGRQHRHRKLEMYEQHTRREEAQDGHVLPW